MGIMSDKYLDYVDNLTALNERATRKHNELARTEQIVEAIDETSDDLCVGVHIMYQPGTLDIALHDLDETERKLLRELFKTRQHRLAGELNAIFCEEASGHA